MAKGIMLLATAAFPGEVVAAFRQLCRQLAETAGEPVKLVITDDARFSDAYVYVARSTPGGALLEEILTPTAAVTATPMTAAPFVYREDGRPDWSAMWESFCDLALYGGPPHRGEPDTLRAPAVVEPVDVNAEAIAEVRRGIAETTGLPTELAGPGWIAVTCHSRKMAAWLCACIILENVEARCDGDQLFLPASPSFSLQDEVKSVVTVLAKTNHYWQAHLQAQQVAASVGPS